MGEAGKTSLSGKHSFPNIQRESHNDDRDDDDDDIIVIKYHYHIKKMTVKK